MNHSWAPALDGYAGIEASPDSIRARNLRARNFRAARPCSSLSSTSNIHSHIIGHRTLDDIEACQQSGGRSGVSGRGGAGTFEEFPAAISRLYTCTDRSKPPISLAARLTCVMALRPTRP